MKYKKLLGSLKKALFDRTITTILLLASSIQIMAEEK